MEKPEPQYIKSIGIPPLKHQVVSPRVMMRPNIAQRMYEISREHSELAKQVTGRNPNKDMPVEMKEAMISMLFAYTCLEAYINRIGHDELGINWNDNKHKNYSLRKKWEEVPKELLRKTTGEVADVFVENKEPFKSFIEFKGIRNSLIHNKAEFYDIELTKYGRMEKLVNVLSSEKAEWACNTVKAMIGELHNALGLSKPSWL
jgi:hypothetical protein